jgi:hypothetical protein
MADEPMVGLKGPQAPSGNAPPLSTLIVRTVLVVLTNLVPLNGVVRLGWNAVSLVLMFILEGVVVLFTDFIKRLFDQSGKDTKVVFVMECAFILFYGFFASMRKLDVTAVLRGAAGSPDRQVRAKPGGGPGCAGDPQDFGGGFRGVGGEDSRCVGPTRPSRNTTWRQMNSFTGMNPGI